MTLLTQFQAERLALGLAVQVTAVVGLAAVLSLSLLRRRPAARHGLWLATLLWVLVCPGIIALGDRASLAFWTLELPALAQSKTRASPPVAAVEPLKSTTDQEFQDAVPPDPGDQTEAPASPVEPVAAERTVSRRGPGILGVLPLIWAGGVVFGLLRTLAGLERVALMLRGAWPLDAARHQQAIDEARQSLGLAVPPPVVVSPRAAGPVAAGLMRPRVVPFSCPTWSYRQLLARQLRARRMERSLDDSQVATPTLSWRRLQSADFLMRKTAG